MKKTSVLVLVLLALVVNSTSIFATPRATPGTAQRDDWRVVEAMTSGAKIRVELKDGKKFEGRLLNVSATTLTLDHSGSSSDYNRDSIAKVHRIVPRSAGKSIAKSAAIGAGIGFGAGAGVGLAAGNYEDLETGELVGILGGIGAAIGAGIGALIGSLASKEKKELVYESR